MDQKAKHPRDVLKDEKIKSLLRGSGLSIYEASAGLGELANELSQAGHKVIVSNYATGVVTYDLDEIAVDLNKPIPLADKRFDAIICRDVIEHIESVPHTLREFNRILKPGGTLILTFPNRLHLRSRIYHLLTGFYHGLKSPLNLSQPLGDGHINLIGYPEMDYFLRHTGYEPTTVDTSRIKASDRLLLPLLPLIRAATAYFLLKHKPTDHNHSKVSPQDRAYNKEILGRVTSSAILLGKDLVIAARKLSSTLN